jgi:hypothetical protein
MAVRAGAVGGVDPVDPALENLRAFVDVLGVGGIRRIELRGDGEFAATEHPFEPPARRMAGQVDERRAGIEADIVRMRFDHGAPLSARAATLSQADEPLRR